MEKSSASLMRHVLVADGSHLRCVWLCCGCSSHIWEVCWMSICVQITHCLEFIHLKIPVIKIFWHNFERSYLNFMENEYCTYWNVFLIAPSHGCFCAELGFLSCFWTAFPVLCHIYEPCYWETILYLIQPMSEVGVVLLSLNDSPKLLLLLK